MNAFNRLILPKIVNNSVFKISSRYCQSSQTSVTKEIDELVKNNKVVVFMKGTPDQPRCGFSNAVVQIMKMYDVKYESHDVLESDELRNGVKEYSNWPTIPQVFINGEFIGGCDIMLQLHQTGKLIEEFKKAGVKLSPPNTENIDGKS